MIVDFRLDNDEWKECKLGLFFLLKLLFIYLYSISLVDFKNKNSFN